jgi:YhcH/YjgK/YiaL family protein
MILDLWKNFPKYANIMPEAVELIENFMKTATPEMEAKSYPLMGDLVKASVFSSKTVSLDAAVFEIHRRYIDIQTLLVGVEDNYYRPCRGLKERPQHEVFNQEQDYQLFEADLENAQHLTLSPDKFAIYFPEEAHLTSLAQNNVSQPIKKIVFKIDRKLMKQASKENVYERV